MRSLFHSEAISGRNNGQTLRAILVVSAFVTGNWCDAQTVSPARDLVNPFIGTGGHGHTFPGACVPNGLVQLSPDTRPDGYMDWDGCGGYHYSDSLIYGFSHTHLSGTGVADLCDVLVMPMSGKASGDPVDYRSAFQHKNETAHAGYYRVWLDDENTLAELTTTAHVGFHRYTMPPDKDQFLVVDLGHRDKVISSSIRIEGTEIIGERRSSSWASDQRLFFCMRIGRSEGPVAIGLELSADTTKAIIAVKREDASAMLVKFGISAVSIEGARANLDAEVPGWDFDEVRQQSEEAWNAKLNKIQVQGGTKEQQRVFYTALYHCYVAPYIFNDVDGNYRGMDGEVHHADHKVYTVFSLWDTFRALHPLMTILEPEMTSDWIKTFLLHYKDGGRLPVWELWGNETDCMIGYHSVTVIADAYIKGIRDFDADLALEAMLASAMRDDPGLNAYRAKGYISSEDAPESVSKTLEYAYDDWCIAQMAMAMKTAVGAGTERAAYLDSVAHAFTVRSYNFQNLFDPRVGFFHARLNGGFKEPFDPFEVNFNFTEANAWQYSMAVQQGKQYLIDLFQKDKRSALAGHLDALFTAESATTGRDQSDITGLIGQYAHGNEPSHHMAYLYNAVGSPQKMAEFVHRITTELYHDSPDGLCGNEDCGQMSAWYVLSAMGFYPVSPGIPWYDLGSPLFDPVKVDVGGGKAFVVNAPRESADQFIVQTRSNEDLMLSHERILAGGTLSLEMTSAYDHTLAENRSVLVSPSIRPPSAPYIQAASRTFSDTLWITIACLNDQGFAYNLNDGKEVTVSHGAARFMIHENTTVRASNGRATAIARFTKFAPGMVLELETPHANQYAAGGDHALIDGLRGGSDFRTGEWQGFEGVDVLATVDLGSVKKLKRAGISMFQDQGAWIWYPEYVDVAWSMNGQQWSSTVLVPNVDRKATGGMMSELWTTAIGKRARYIKIMAKNAGPCPEWHPGKGGRTWIFLDEILIETE